MQKINQMEEVMDKIQGRQLQTDKNETNEKKIVQITTDEIFDELLEMNDNGQMVSSNKLKSDRLKQLVERDIEISGSMKKQVFRKKENQEQEGITGQQKVFKKRVLNNKKVVKLVDDNDDDQSD
eukprot:TRINITY_DN18995_c0_g1_i3.p5 TRINITY_DN18995_c0_g1~~TRINITY_DN18995_c0_g1_i3.p5  ORF type:complete len:124 (-),score=33.71 TRINITY_DN18995_c0_g1_i3:4-375(-)